ncbi:MAG: hypothetical protein Kow0097_03110 [Candidatus Bipolaricaulota bacterium]
MLALVGLTAGSVLGWARSTTVGAQATVTIPALTRLSVLGMKDSGREIPVAVKIPSPVPDRSEPVELRQAVTLVVRSNVPWTLVVRSSDLSPWGIVELRIGSGEYRPVQPEGLVLARGLPGVHEIVLDYRVNLGEAGWSGERTLTLIYAVEG